jgi:uncharacterized membrane protein YphA (DoxX/SURF4 family)
VAEWKAVESAIASIKSAVSGEYPEVATWLAVVLTLVSAAAVLAGGVLRCSSVKLMPLAPLLINQVSVLSWYLS